MLFLMVVHVINRRTEEDQRSLTSLYQENFQLSEWDRKCCIVHLYCIMCKVTMQIEVAHKRLVFFFNIDHIFETVR